MNHLIHGNLITKMVCKNLGGLAPSNTVSDECILNENHKNIFVLRFVVFQQFQVVSSDRVHY